MEESTEGFDDFSSGIETVGIRATTTIVSFFELVPEQGQSTADLVAQLQQDYEADPGGIGLVIEDLDNQQASIVTLVEEAPVFSVPTGGIDHPDPAQAIAVDKISQHLTNFVDRSEARRQAHKIMSILKAANLAVVDRK